MAKAKLKSALDQYRGRNIRLEKQRKKEKEARKRKEKNKLTDDEEDDVEEGGVSLLGEPEVKVNGKPKKVKKNGVVKKAAVVEEPEWETEESGEEEGSSDEDDDDMLARATLDMSKLEDSDSEGSSDDEDMEDAEDDVEEDQDDIALSDIESLASEDKGDIIPHQRLTINNTTALTAALNRISLPYSKLAFSEYQSITSDEPTDIPDVEDDLNRELAFYKQCLSAVKDAREKLKKEGVGFSRPADYFAEMVKSDEHMGKIKQKLVDEAAGKKAAAEARKQRDLKKFGKQVQVAKLQERAKDKRDTMEKINILKRSTSPYPWEFLTSFLTMMQSERVQMSRLPMKTSSTSNSKVQLRRIDRTRPESLTSNAKRKTQSLASVGRRGMLRVTTQSLVQTPEASR
jgi:rRNA-processing protein EBP2